MRLYFLETIIANESILLEKIPTKFYPPDMGIKVPPLNKFWSWLKLLNIDTV